MLFTLHPFNVRDNSETETWLSQWKVGKHDLVLYSLTSFQLDDSKWNNAVVGGSDLLVKYAGSGIDDRWNLMSFRSGVPSVRDTRFVDWFFKYVIAYNHLHDQFSARCYYNINDLSGSFNQRNVCGYVLKSTTFLAAYH